MRNLEKSLKRDADEPSLINCLPDEIILQILKNLIDLKNLCSCYLVSRRFSSIVVQVDAISLTALSLSSRIPNKNIVGHVEGGSSVCGESFKSATTFLSKFRGVKSLCIELPSSSDGSNDKWEVKFGHRIQSLIFLSPISICDKDGTYLYGNGFEEVDTEQLPVDLLNRIAIVSLKHLKVVFLWHMILLKFVKDLPMLEKVSIIYSGKTGKLSLCGEKLNEVKEWINSASETEKNHLEIPDVLSVGHIPVLKLPVSGYVMKGIIFAVLEMKDIQGGNDFLKKSENGFDDKEEAIFTEAMMEILEKHRGKLIAYPLA